MDGSSAMFTFSVRELFLHECIIFTRRKAFNWRQAGLSQLSFSILSLCNSSAFWHPCSLELSALNAVSSWIHEDCCWWASTLLPTVLLISWSRKPTDGTLNLLSQKCALFFCGFKNLMGCQKTAAAKLQATNYRDRSSLVMGHNYDANVDECRCQ